MQAKPVYRLQNAKAVLAYYEAVQKALAAQAAK